MPFGAERLAPFGVPVVPEVRSTNFGSSSGGISSSVSVVSIRSSIRSSPSSGSSSPPPPAEGAGGGAPPADPGDEALGAPAPRRELDQLGELGVVDRGLRLLALEDLVRLRRREARVE